MPAGARYASYGSLLLGVTGFPKTPKTQNTVTQETTLECPGAKKFLITIGKFPAWVQFGYYPQGVAAGQASIVWLNPQYYPAMMAALQRDADAVRAWAAEAANEPEIIINPA